MSALRYAIGVDIGTTSTKAVLFTEAGVVVDRHAVEYPLYMPVAGAAEQDPDEIFAAVIQSVKAVMSGSGLAQPSEGISPEDLICVSFSAAMHSTIAWLTDKRSLWKQPNPKWLERRGIDE